MKTDNELIAIFMGFTPQKSSLGNTYTHPDLMGVYGGTGMKFKYDTSWNWLMPVVEKISKISRNDYDGQARKDIQYLKQIWANTPFYVSIERAYELVVEFIKWYNSQKNPMTEEQDSLKPQI